MLTPTWLQIYCELDLLFVSALDNANLKATYIC